MSDEQPPRPLNLQPDFEVPPGFTLGLAGPDNCPVLIPYYMMPALEQTLAVRKAHQQPIVANASAKVRQASCALAFLITYQPVLVQPKNYLLVSDVEVKVPPNPVSTVYTLFS